MSKPSKPPGDYEIGYRKPPKAHQFRKNQTGNAKGRPRKKECATDVLSVIEEPLIVKVGDKTSEMHPFEISTRKLAQNATNGNLRAIIRFIKLCEEYAVFTPPPSDTGNGVLVAPPGVDFHEWLESVTEEIPAEE